jgi:hypothetical protein
MRYITPYFFVSVQAVFVKQPGVFINDGTGTPFK